MRSVREAIVNGRTLKEGHKKFARPGLGKLKEKMGEKAAPSFPRAGARQRFF